MENIFPWDNNNLGGTEVAMKWFHKNVLPEMKNIRDYRCISVPGAPQSLEEIFQGKRNILWLHLTPDQVDDSGLNVLKREDFKETVEKIVVISNFHKKKTALEMNVDPDMIHVVEYPIGEIPFNPTKFDNVKVPKIIHASQAVRGMDILLQAVRKIEDDFELNIYNDFYPEQYDNPALDELMKDERITFYGKTPRSTVLKALADSHIHAYPSIFEETSCMIQAEALASGNLCVYSNIGVLPETSREHGTMVDFSVQEFSVILDSYTNALTDAINKVKNGQFDPKDQIKDIVEYRKDERIINQWLDFDKSLAQ